MNTLRRFQTVFVFLLLLPGARPSAHELGSMKVNALFTADGTYQIDVALNADHLPAEFIDLPNLGDSSVLGDRGGSLDIDRAQAPGGALAEAFLREMHVAIDGVPAQPEASLPPVNPSTAAGSAPRKIVLRYRGSLPAGATQFTWSQSFAPGTYLFGSRNEADADVAWQWLEGPVTSAPVTLLHAPPPLTRAEIVRTYLVLGFTHILPGGLDHILFVLGLFLLSLRRKTILAQITAFTIAHSITLGLTIYGVLSLSPKIVEPLIALSIVYVAVENLFRTEVSASRLAIVFCFGLLHGLGFAGVLRELGLPRSEFLTALVSFNAGVEAGQLTVVSLAFLCAGLWFGHKSWYRQYLTVPASIAIGLVGLFWTVQRATAG